MCGVLESATHRAHTVKDISTAANDMVGYGFTFDCNRGNIDNTRSLPGCNIIEGLRMTKQKQLVRVFDIIDFTTGRQILETFDLTW